MEEALLANRVVVLDQGKLARDDSPKHVFADPAWLRERQLDVPEVCSLAELLRERGFGQFQGVTSPEELMEIVCK